MIIEKEQNEYILGKMSDVKYVKTFVKEEFMNKFNELQSFGYKPVWKRGKNEVILQKKYRDTDVVILSCKQKINTLLYAPHLIVEGNRSVLDEIVRQYWIQTKQKQGYAVKQIEESSFYCAYTPEK